MKTFGHVLLHVGAIALQAGIAAGHFVPFPFNIAAAGGVAAIQGIVALVAAKKSPATREAPPILFPHDPK